MTKPTDIIINVKKASLDNLLKLKSAEKIRLYRDTNCTYLDYFSCALEICLDLQSVNITWLHSPIPKIIHLTGKITTDEYG